MTKAMWQVVIDTARFSSAHAHELRDSHWIGGDPRIDEPCVAFLSCLETRRVWLMHACVLAWMCVVPSHVVIVIIVISSTLFSRSSLTLFNSCLCRYERASLSSSLFHALFADFIQLINACMRRYERASLSSALFSLSSTLSWLILFNCSMHVCAGMAGHRTTP
jgi:hypothetical protein